MFERYRRIGRVAYSAAGAGSGGGSGSGGAGEGGGEQPQRRSSADVLQQYGGDAIRMADRVAELERENYRYREQKRDLTTEMTTLKGKQVPEGAVVLTGADVTAYEAYAALGKPDEVKARLTERDTLAAEVAATKREKSLAEVAEAAGWNPAPLKRIGADREYELRDATADGKAVKVPYIKDGDTFKPLAEYAASEWSDVLPALQASGNGQSNGNGGGQGGGVTYPAQRGGGGQQQSAAQVANNYVTSTYKGPPKRG